MKKKLIDAFTKNIGIKILATAFAIILWIAVVNVDDPEKTVSFTATVQVTNENVLSAKNQFYNYAGTNTVSFRARAKRSIIEKMTAADFSATADLNDLTTEGKVPIVITPKVYSNRVMIVSGQKYLSLKVGTVTEKRFRIDGRSTGTPQEGYVVSSVETSPNVISVSGPESVVSKIETVTAAADVDGIAADITESVTPVFYDANGKQVDSKNLTVNVAAVEVTAHIQSVKKVQVRVETSGELADGLTLGSVTADPAEVEVTGASALLNDLSEITVPGTVVDLSGISEDWTTTVDLTEYLPEGVTLVNPEDAKAEIKVILESDSTAAFEVPVSNLMVRNLSQGLTSEFQGSSVTVMVSGKKSDLDQLSASEITGYIDATGLSAGTYRRPVTWNLTGDLKAGETEAEVVIADSSGSD